MTAEQLFYKNFSLLSDEQKAAVLVVIEAFLVKVPNKPNMETPKKKRGGYGSLKGKSPCHPTSMNRSKT